MSDTKYHRCGRKFKDKGCTSNLHKVMLGKGMKTSELHRRIESDYPMEDLGYASLLKSVKGTRALRNNEINMIAEILNTSIADIMELDTHKK